MSPASGGPGWTSVARTPLVSIVIITVSPFLALGPGWRSAESVEAIALRPSTRNVQVGSQVVPTVV